MDLDDDLAADDPFTAMMTKWSAMQDSPLGRDVAEVLERHGVNRPAAAYFATGLVERIVGAGL